MAKKGKRSITNAFPFLFCHRCGCITRLQKLHLFSIFEFGDPMTTAHCCVSMAHTMMPQYANPQGSVQGEDITKLINDAPAIVAMRHSRSTVATAAVQQLSFHHPFFIGNLLSLKASLNLTGRTSMQTGVLVEAENPLSGKLAHIASAYLTFVAMDENRHPKEIKPWVPHTSEAKRREQDAKERTLQKNFKQLNLKERE